MGHLICRETGKTYSLNEPIWRSPDGGLLDINFEPPGNFMDNLSSQHSGLWRYKAAIPVKDEAILDFGDGFTPLVPMDLYGHSFRVKLDYLFNSFSFKDRGAAVLISKVNEMGLSKVIMDSSGNAGTSVSLYCAKAGITCDIYTKEDASPAKLTQIGMYGANLKTIPGSRAEVTKAVMKAAQTEFYASHYWNPFFFEGTKTYAYEIYEQTNGRIPDSLFFQVGHGTLLIGCYKGFKELQNEGLIDKMPRLYGIQTQNCKPLYNHLNGLPLGEPDHTIAEGINIEDPPRLAQVSEMIRETGGEVYAVSEEEIKEAMKDAASRGYYIEAASASALAALKHHPQQQDDIVIPLTGNGLKNTEKFQQLMEGTL